jgi:hypothetical protein
MRLNKFTQRRCADTFRSANGGTDFLAFLQEQNAQPIFGGNLRGNRTSRASTDDNNIKLGVEH